MKILAIDQSLTNFAICQGDSETLTMTTKLLKPKEKGAYRLIEIRAFLNGLMLNSKPDAVVIEGYSYMSKSACIYQIGELGGMLRVWAHDVGLPLHVVAPTALKKFVCGRGNAKKDLMLKMAYKKFGFDSDDDNIVDAYCLFRYFVSEHGKLQQKKEE